MRKISLALFGAALLAGGLAARAAAPDTEAVEFYNTTTGHYFLTANASEALGIDDGAAGPGWERTGRSFQVWSMKSAAPADAQPVCRFYSSGANSHFYTASAGECQQLKMLEATERNATGTVKGWGYEGTAFYVQTPTDSGQCPAGTTQIMRIYNNGFATGAGSNHRFVDDAGALTERYPFNPNGSARGVAALCSPDGRHLAIMPHPERSFLTWQCPWLPEEWRKTLPVSPWMRVFQNARRSRTETIENIAK